MFGNTYPIVGIEKRLGERIADRELADYVRWEFAAGDRSSVIVALGRARTEGRRRSLRGLVPRFRSWRAAARKASAKPEPEPRGLDAPLPSTTALELGLLYRAFPNGRF